MGAVMGRRTWDMVDLLELFLHWGPAGLRCRCRDQRQSGTGSETVRKYLAPAVAEGICPDGAAGEEVWAERVARWFPEVADSRLRQLTWPAIAAHRDFIVKQLEDGVTVATISHRLIDEPTCRRPSLRCGGGSPPIPLASRVHGPSSRS